MPEQFREHQDSREPFLNQFPDVDDWEDYKKHLDSIPLEMTAEEWQDFYSKQEDPEGFMDHDHSMDY